MRGSVSALGVFGWFVGTVRTGSGSGGSILLVGQQGVDVLATGSIDARGGTMGAMHEGYVRLDSYSRPPTVLGSVFPAPMLVELPHLRAPQPPTPGGQWTIEARGPRGDAVVLALGSTPIAPVATPYGVLAIDPGTVAMLGVASVPNQLVDPMGSLGVPIPPLPALVGVVLHVQGVDVLANGSPRLSNLLVATIQ